MIRRIVRTATLVLFASLGLNAYALPPPACTTISVAPATTLPGGTVGTSYSQTFSASGSAATPYGYQVTSGVPVGFGVGMNASTGDFTGTLARAGNFLITITATDGNGCSGGRTYALAVAKGSQTISFTSSAPSATVGGATYTPTASATSGLPVALSIDASSTSGCSISGGVVTFNAPAGSCVIDANQAGDANWNAAVQAQQTVTVAKGDQTITFSSTPPVNPKIGDPAYTVAATATSGLPVTFSSGAPAVCTVSGTSVSFVGSGTCIVHADQAGDGNWNAAPQAQQSFTVAKKDQTITFTSTAPAGAKNSGAPYTVTATASSGLAVAFSSGSLSVCTVSGSTVSFVGAGTCIVNADQAGDATYNAAPQAQQSFPVLKGDQTITFTSTAPAYGSATAAASPHTYTATATASSGLTVTFTTSGACGNSGGLVTFGPGAGACTIMADQAGDGNWNAAAQVTQSVAVEIPASAGADSHAVTGNVAISVPPANGVLANDNGTAIAIKSYGASTGAEQGTLGSATATAAGGTVALNANGSYSYDPPANFTGTDTFKYTLGNDLTGPGSTSIGTVTLTVSDRIMVVATGGVGAGDCKPQSACTLATADGKAAVTSGNDLVFVTSGAYSSAAFSLVSGQNFVGQQVSLSTALTDVGITLATDSVTAPITAIGASAQPTLHNSATVLTLGGGNLVEYFTINPSGGSGIAGNAITTGTSNIHDIAITGSSGANGVNLTSNTGATFNFSNLAITTASGTAFAATGGGTVNVTAGSVPNTLNSSASAALNIANTTIGSSGLTFQSITSGSAANSAPNGIILDTTGASGGLTVTGTGTAGSGGTIQHKTGADGSTSQGSGIYLNSTKAPSFAWMQLNDFQNYAIYGSNVSGFTLTNSVINGANGTSVTGYGEGSVMFGDTAINGATGTVTFTNDAISGGRARNLSIVNGGAASTTTLTVKGCVFGALQNFSDGNQSFAVEARTSGSTFNTVFGGPGAGEPNTLTNAVSDLANFTGQTGTTMDVQFKNNALSNNNSNNIIGGSSLVLATQGVMTFNADSNTMRDANGSAVTLFKASAGTSLSGRFTNNTIGVAGVVDSGSLTGNGIFVSAGGTGTMAFTISNNQIHQIHGNGHIYADNTGGSYTANFTIEGNTLDTFEASQFAAIAITNGAPSSPPTPDDTVNVCAKIGGTTAAEKNTLNLAGSLGVVVGSSGAASGHTFNLPSYTGGANFTNVQNFIQANNTGSFTTSAYADAPATAAAFTGAGTTCPTP